ncbi:MAG: hypothetical protein PVI01_08715 [Gemmatimonadales bacterium]
MPTDHGGDDPVSYHIFVSLYVTGTPADTSFAVLVDEQDTHDIVYSDTSLTFEQLRILDVGPGTHTVELLGVPSNCSLAGSNPRTFAFDSWTVAQLSFQLACSCLVTMPSTERIVFGSDRDGSGGGFHGRTYSADPDGANLVRSAWPGGSVNPDGIRTLRSNSLSSSFRVTDLCDLEEYGRADHALFEAWSPDGQTLLLTDAGEWHLQIMDADGSNRKTLVAHDADMSGFPDWSPDWSPTGLWIAFGTTGYLGAIRPDGSALARIVEDTADFMEPDWSPDGDRLVFVRRYGSYEGDRDVLVVGSDGTGIINLTRDAEAAGYWWPRYPSWSPDGTSVAFDAFRIGGQGPVAIVITADGKTTAILDGHDPIWSPDGARLALNSRRDGNAEVYVVNRDGSGPVNISRHPSRDYLVAWWNPPR